MKKIIFHILILLTFITNGFAQQDPQYSHYMFNNVAFNPGFAGTDGLISANLISHDQWLGWEGAPKTRFVSIDAPIKFLGESGVGLSIYNDVLGFEKNFNAKLAYSYHKTFGTSKLGIGFDIGFLNKSIDNSSFQFPEIDESDLFSNIDRKMALDLGIGLFYKYDDLFLGFSSTHINRPSLQYDPAGKYKLKNHYILTGGYNMILANALIDMTPSFLLKSDGTTLQYDINLMFKYNKKNWGGVTYRNKDAVVLFVGTSMFSDVKIGLAYDLTLSKIQTVSNGTFEVYIGYSFSIDKTPKVQQYRSVRYL